MPLVRASAPLSPGRRSNDDEKAVAAVLSGRKRGFILDVQVKGLVDDFICSTWSRWSSKAREDRETWKQDIPGRIFLKSPRAPPQMHRWKKVVVRLPGLQELKDSLTGLTVACNDVNSDKWLSRLANTRWFAVVIIF